MAKKTLYLAFPICDEFQRYELDKMNHDELFETMCSSENAVEIYFNIDALFEDLNNEEIESINFWLYKIEIDEVKFNEWYNN